MDARPPAPAGPPVDLLELAGGASGSEDDRAPPGAPPPPPGGPQAFRGQGLPRCTVGPDASAGAAAHEADGAPGLGGWLARALLAERAAVAALLEARHDALVQQFERGGALARLAGRRRPSPGRSRTSPGALRATAPPCAPAPPAAGAAPPSEGALGWPPLPGALQAGGVEEARWPEAPHGQRPEAPLPDLAGGLARGKGGRSVTFVSTPGSCAASQRAAVPPSPAGLSATSPAHRMVQTVSDLSSLVFLKRDKGESPLARFVSSTAFEAAGAAVVILLAFCMALESQYAGLELGFQLGYGAYGQPAARSWPWAVRVFDALNWAMGMAFCLELALKLLGIGIVATLGNVWGCFDAAVTMLWIVETTLSFNEVVAHLDVSLFRLVRLLRLARFIRLVRMSKILDSLYLICTALAGSVSALGWSCIILFLAQVIVAFVLNETLSVVYFYDDRYDEEERREVFAYFGTFSRAILSTFEMTLANWPPVCRLLVENVSEWFVLPCLVHKLTVGFAVVGVINGVFIQETFKCAHDDDLLIIRQKERATATHVRKMRKLFAAADENGNGVLDRKEFQRVLQHDDVRTWLAAMDYDLEDTDLLFNMLDANGDETISPEEFVKGITRLRGSAKSVDVKRLLNRQGPAVVDVSR